MNRAARITCVLAAGALVLPGSGAAKGVTEAQIEGPGLERPIELRAALGPEGVMRLAETVGFFAATFGQSPDPMLEQRPVGTVGPRYRLTFVMSGADSQDGTVVQDVYPYARPHAVSYTPPGQRVFTHGRTRGSWFIAHDGDIGETLVQAGLSRTPPRASDGSELWSRAGTAAALALAGAAALVLRRRLGRRRQTSTVTASRSAS